MFIVAACGYDFNVARIERYLVLAREVGVHPVVVLTKADLTDSADAYAEAAAELQSDLEVTIVNAREQWQRGVARRLVRRGRDGCLLGSSGVGKSTLINTLRGSQGIAT